MRNQLSQIASRLGPGTRKFLGSLSLVTAGFAVAKVFSSIATIIMARFIGAENFGEANVVMLVGQVISLLMLGGLHVSLMRYASDKKDPAPEIATVFWLGAFTVSVVGIGAFAAHQGIADWLGRWLTVTPEKVLWAIVLAIMFSGYALFTSAYQAMARFSERGIIEAVLAFLLLPGLALGFYLTGQSHQSVLVAYMLAYAVCIAIMLWKLRGNILSHSWSSETKSIIAYGLFACLSNIGYVLTFVVQPLQIEWATGTKEVGIFRIYCSGSINTAMFATGIFYTVFFPKVSSSTNRLAVWGLVTRSWKRAAVPIFLLFCMMQAVTVLASGSEYPFHMHQVFLFGLASTLITVQATYGQILAAQGIAGIRWGLALSLVSGGINFGLSYWLIPQMGITGAVLAIIGNYAVTLVGTVALRRILIIPDEPVSS